MRVHRRKFLKWSATAGLAVGAAGCADSQTQAQSTTPPSPIAALRPMTAGIVPITLDERRARIEIGRAHV